MNNLLPNDFNIELYKLLNEDLKHMNSNELKYHYLKHGIHEGRKYKYELPKDFNIENYKLLNNDLKNMSKIELKLHYMNYGIYENRSYKLLDTINKNIKLELPQDFNLEIYRLLNNDLKDLTNTDLVNHFINYGIYEDRIYKIILPIDFNLDIYKNLYNDLINLSNIELENHYFLHGFSERRLYNEENIENIENIENNNNIKINFINYILWINLLESDKRKYEMENILSTIEIPNIRINAINGNNLDYYKLINLEMEDKQLSKYQIACILSHIKLIHKLKNMNGSFFMICEDDISFNNLKYFKKNLKDIILESPKFDILILNKICNYEINDNYIKFNNYDINIWSTASYIISREGIDKICDLVNYNNIDTFIFHKKINVADIFIYKYVDTYVYKYNFIDTNIFDSTINNSNKYNLIYNSIKETNLIKENINLL